MSEMLMINEVAKNYKITKRTIRYYEEIGLLTNVKKNNSNYRYYDYEVLNRLEQILLLIERMFEVSQFIGDIITIEFGINIIECADMIIENIKKLRQEIKSQLNKEIPLIRIKDNLALEGNGYKIVIKGVTVKKGLLEIGNANKKSTIINEALKEALICNIHSITE